MEETTNRRDVSGCRAPDDYPESVHDEAAVLLGMVRRQRQGWRFHLDLRAKESRTWVWCRSEPGFCNATFHERPAAHERGVMEFLSPPVCWMCGGSHTPSECPSTPTGAPEETP